MSDIEIVRATCNMDECVEEACNGHTYCYKDMEETFKQGQLNVIEQILSTTYFNDKLKIYDMNPYINLNDLESLLMEMKSKISKRITE